MYGWVIPTILHDSTLSLSVFLSDLTAIFRTGKNSAALGITIMQLLIISK